MSAQQRNDEWSKQPTEQGKSSPLILPTAANIQKLQRITEVKLAMNKQNNEMNRHFQKKKHKWTVTILKSV